VQSRSWSREFIEVLLIFVIFTLFVRTFVVAHINVPTPSMVPTVLVGDHILVNRFIFAPHLDTPLHRLLPYRDPQIGDVVTFAQPDRPRRDLIKRIVATGGDVISIEAKKLFRNGNPVDEPRTQFTDPEISLDDPSEPPSRRVRDHLAPLTLPPDHLFCLGDNRDESLDSRVFGSVPRSTIRGRALLVYWSFDSEEQSSSRGLGRLFYLPLHFLSKTRWDRQFETVR